MALRVVSESDEEDDESSELSRLRLFLLLFLRSFFFDSRDLCLRLRSSCFFFFLERCDRFRSFRSLEFDRLRLREDDESDENERRSCFRPRRGE